MSTTKVPTNHFESLLMASAISAAQRFFNKGILSLMLDENLTPRLVFKTRSGVKTSRAIDELVSTWNGNFSEVVEFLINEAHIAYSARIFSQIEAVL